MKRNWNLNAFDGGGRQIHIKKNEPLQVIFSSEMNLAMV
jgi:hypothetical protein